MFSIYYYTEPHLYLRDVYEETKKNDDSFSIRALASNLGMKGHSALYQMVEGKRSIPKRYVPNLIQTFKMTPKEGLYLEGLIDLKKAKSLDQRQMYLERLKELSPLKSEEIFEMDTFKVISHPLHTTLLELTCLRDFKYNIDWIKDRLFFKYTDKEIRQAIKRLIELKLLEEKQGTLTKTSRHLTSKVDVKDMGLRNFHKSLSQMAIQAIDQQGLMEREFNAYSFCINKESLPLAKKMLREFSFEFMNKLEAPKGEELYHLNLQFFKLSQGNTDGGQNELS